MPRHSVDFDTVRKLAPEIGAVEECTVHGAPSLKVRGKLSACIAVHKSAEPTVLVRLSRRHGKRTARKQIGAPGGRAKPVRH